MANENGNRNRRNEDYSNFPQEIIDMIVRDFDRKQDKVILHSLYKLSPFWEHAALKKLYSEICEEDLDDINNRPYCANYVKRLVFNDQSCGYCHKLKNIKFHNLNKMILYDIVLCGYVEQFLCQNTSIQHLEMDPCIDTCVLQTIMDARTQAPYYQPLLSYHGPLNENIARYLLKLGTKSIRADTIQCEDIVPCFAQFSDLRGISLYVDNYKEDIFIGAIKYLTKLKSLSSFELNKMGNRFSPNVFNELIENVLKPNAVTLQNLKMSDILGPLKLPLDQHWPNLKTLQIGESNVCPMNLIKFCEKASNIEYIRILCIDENFMVQDKVDIPIKIINTLKNLSFMEINAYMANGPQIRYIQSQRVDETLCIEDGRPVTKLYELKETLQEQMDIK